MAFRNHACTPLEKELPNAARFSDEHMNIYPQVRVLCCCHQRCLLCEPCCALLYPVRNMTTHATKAVWMLAAAVMAAAGEPTPIAVGGTWDTRDGQITDTSTDTSIRQQLKLPLVVNTWTGAFSSATERAWAVIFSGEAHSSLLDAVEQVGAGKAYAFCCNSV